MVVEEIRQSQFILQGSVGALRNNEKRTYMITSSLDHWLSSKDDIDLDDLTIEYPLILSRKTVEMLDNQKGYSKIREFASIGHYAKKKA